MQSRFFGISVLFLTLLGVALRFIATRGEPWLDEMWSVELVRGVRNPFDILLEVLHDNNHPINSLWLWFLGEPRPAWAYRLPSVFFSTLALGMVALRALSTRELWRLAMLTLLSTSFMMVLYGSEARGYALTIACAIVGFTLVEDLVKTPSIRTANYLGIVCSLGALSHAIFLPFIGSLSIWLVYVRLTQPNLTISRAMALRAGYAPLALAGFLALVFYGRLTVGGAPIVPFAQVGASTLMVMFGGPEVSVNALPLSVWWLCASLCALGCCLVELYLWNRSRDPLALLVALNVAAPLVVVLGFKPPFILSRYFLIGVFFLYLLTARFLARMAIQGRLGALVATSLIGIFVWKNGELLSPLLSGGRAHHRDAFSWMASSASSVTVGGENDFQNHIRLEYYRPHSEHLQALHYVNSFLQQSSAPQFIILESVDPFETFEQTRTFGQHGTYELARSYPAPLLSGSRWFVYERINVERDS